MFFFSFLRKTFFLPVVAALAITVSVSSRWSVASNWHPIKLFLAWGFLLSNRRAARAFARTRVGVRALSANRKSASMPQATIRPDVHQALDVHLNPLAQIAFDFALTLDDRTDAAEIIFSQVTNVRIYTHLRFVKNRG